MFVRLGSDASLPLSPAAGGGINVAIPPDQQSEMIDGALVTQLGGGGLEINLEPDNAAPSIDNMGHLGNLAEIIDETILAGIADELIEGIEADIASNEEWHSICERGVELLGIKAENRDEVFKGASGDFHPMMLEAVIRGQANARAEMLPAGGPVRTEMLESMSDASEAQQQSARKQQWMNYYLTTVDEGYYPDFDQMLLYLFIYGSTFKKVYTDPLLKRPAAPFILPKQLIMSYTATDVGSCGRVTHETLMSHGDLIRMQLAGAYREVSLSEPMEDGEETIGERTEGRARDMIIGDDRHTIWETHCDLDIPFEGVEHKHPRTGRRSGLPLPFVVTIDRDSRKILALRRNWKEDDPDFRRLQFFVHYRMMPGLGVYGWGYAHVMASSTESATKLRRCLVDGSLLANFPGGFMAKQLKQEQNDQPIGPCEFRQIDLNGIPDIRGAVMPLPYKEPGPAVTATMEEIVESGQRIGNTMDMAVGDGREDVPVGTVLALIEKATRPESAVIKRLHAAHKKELRLLADQFGQAPPGTKYPFKVGDFAGVAVAEDFANSDDILPVSDPNIPTQTQRLAQAQAKLDLAKEAPQLHDLREAYADMYRVMGTSAADINRIMPPPQQAQPLDPVSENMNAVKGTALAVGPQQNHAAHAQVHMAFMQLPGLPPQVLQAMAAHLADHLNAAYRQQVEAALGHPLPPPGAPLPPEIESMLSIAAAHVSQQVTQTLSQMLPQAQGGQDPSVAVQREANQVKLADIQAKQQDAERKAEESARQDQLEVWKTEQEMQDNRAARAHEETLAMIDLRATQVQAASDDRATQAGLEGQAMETNGATHQAAMNVVAEAVKGGASLATEHARHATEDTKGQHATNTAKAAAKGRTAKPSKKD